MSLPAKPQTPPDHAAERRVVRWLMLVAIGLVIASIWFGKVLDQILPKPRLPVFATITHDLEATERSGRTVRLSSLRGQVFTCAYLYTVCPHGCSAVTGQMLKLNQRFGSRPDFHQVSVTVAPERDTPPFLNAYAEGMGVKTGNPWWFIGGNQTQLWAFMENELLLTPSKPIPLAERLNPLDLYVHDLRIVLIDRKGRIRGYYAVFHPQPEIARLMCERLQRDTENLLNDPRL